MIIYICDLSVRKKIFLNLSFFSIISKTPWKYPLSPSFKRFQISSALLDFFQLSRNEVNPKVLLLSVQTENLNYPIIFCF